MPPINQTPEARIRYFTRLLAACVRQYGKNGELTIKRSLLAELNGEPSRQALIEDSDSNRSSLVLRFASKDAAVYPFEGDGVPCPPPQPSQVRQQTGAQELQDVLQTVPNFQPRSVAPWTDKQLADAELKIRRIRTANRLAEEKRRRNASSSPLDASS